MALNSRMDLLGVLSGIVSLPSFSSFEMRLEKRSRQYSIVVWSRLGTQPYLGQNKWERS